MEKKKVGCPGCGAVSAVPAHANVVQCSRCAMFIHLSEGEPPPPEEERPPDDAGPPDRPAEDVPAPPVGDREVRVAPGMEGGQHPAGAEEEAPSADLAGGTPLPEDLEPTRCPACDGDLNGMAAFSCEVCGSGFCMRCPGRHVPPGSNSLVLRIRYKYRQRGGPGQWSEESTRFSQRISSRICPSCYVSEFERALDILNAQVRTWFEGLVQDEDARIIEKELPEMCIDLPGRRDAV